MIVFDLCSIFKRYFHYMFILLPTIDGDGNTLAVFMIYIKITKSWTKPDRILAINIM